MIDAKLAAEQLQEVATMVDMRFGHGTWAGILAERARRIQEAKEASAKARREQIKKSVEMEENIKMALGIFAIVAVVVCLFIFLMVSVARALII